MSPSKCSSILECSKVRIILEGEGATEQMINDVNSVCAICLGPDSYRNGQVSSKGLSYKLSH